MKLIKRVTKFAITATMASAILSVPVFASNEASASPSPAQSSSGIISPFAVNNIIVNNPIAGSSFSKSFSIPANYGWVKVWVQNTSTETLTVRVTKGTATGTEKMLFSVAPGDSYTAYGTAAWATGEHTVSISTKNGGNMSGQLSVKLATTLAEL